MKRALVTMPMLLPRMPDRATTHLLDVLALLHDYMLHHYGSRRSTCMTIASSIDRTPAWHLAFALPSVPSAA